MAGDLSKATSAPCCAAVIHALVHRYGHQTAVAIDQLSIPAGVMAGLIGPDGVGKSTLLALITGVKRLQQGDIQVLDGNIRSFRFRRDALHRIAYMPQGLGRNLYPTLSVAENLDFFANLFGQAKAERQQRIDLLTRATGLHPFLQRPAGKLSGGMKQKLSLCCALIHDPDLLILDEPTTGVDPLSRQQFWQLIRRIRSQRPDMSVIVATAYMEEAQDFDWLAAMDDGAVIASGTPEQLLQQTGSQTLEQAFIQLLPEAKRQQHQTVTVPPLIDCHEEPAIEAHALTRRFGDFVAVDRVSFNIKRGEIFGFLGSNGCGKTTTMKMLTGLLPASSGEARLFGQKPAADDMQTRQRVGYMSQSFSLYSEISVQQNLELHSSLYKMKGADAEQRIQEVMQDFGLRELAGAFPASLPLGIRQRLQLAVAVLHKPDILILDEPTSGVDPVARDTFWHHLIRLSREQGVTIFISTHFMNEAARCDRVSLMHAGKVLAVGKPTELAQARGHATLETAFVDYLQQAAAESPAAVIAHPAASLPATPPGQPAPQQPGLAATATNKVPDRKHQNTIFSLRRWWAYAFREMLEIQRDPIRLTFALLGPLFLMLAFGYGISFDVEELSYAVLDQDQSRESRLLQEAVGSSRYFSEQPAISDYGSAVQQLQSGKLAMVIDIPPNFGRDYMRYNQPEVQVLLDGAMPFKAETGAGYIAGMTVSELMQIAQRDPHTPITQMPADVSTRFLFNQAFKSVYSIVPGVVMLMLVLIPTMMTALGIVREKETGSIANFHSTPVTRLEFLLGKQTPYLLIGLLSFITLMMMAVWLFQVPVKGSFSTLATGALLYVFTTTGFGLVISAFTRTQVAAMFASAVLTVIPSVNFSGLLTPVSTLNEGGRLIGMSFPSSWFQQISIGTFTKALGWQELWWNHLALAVFVVIFTLLAWLGLNKQER
ncbi:ribosome-associated ATPase/putative transporter RbbA [Thalassolituus sp. LLYu03]|uniref:ribosome-associated ATPase/putative transporter RbbA n=1 Tax=Thalassolituus sp. LLYu03 TaxID=3421656 RepID=UPI003D2D5460